jgi:DTW domain-containing protein YfiP
MRTRRAARCEVCHLAHEACLCALIEPIVVRTEIALLVHHVESHKTSHTARLAALAMGARYELWGHPERPRTEPIEGPLLLLFPTPDARLLCERDAGARLVVPGNWAQARKIANRVLRDWPGPIEAVRIMATTPSAYPFRVRPREDALCTFEALIAALAILEGPARGPAVQAEALALFQRFVLRQARASRRAEAR